MADAEALYDDITAAPAEAAAPAAASEGSSSAARRRRAHDLGERRRAPARRPTSARGGRGDTASSSATWRGGPTDAQLAALCAEHGKLLEPPQFFEDPINGKSKGSALVRFADADAAAAAVEKLSGRELDGRKLVVSAAGGGAAAAGAGGGAGGAGGGAACGCGAGAMGMPGMMPMCGNR